MKAFNIEGKEEFFGPHPVLPIIRSEWIILLCGAALSFWIASLMTSGFSEGLFPNFVYPFSYDGDALSHAWMTQRAVEGWLFENPRNGYPFGSNFLDYPGSDSGSLLLLKVLGYLGGGFQATINLYFLLGFSFIFCASYLCLRSMGARKSYAAAGAMIYCFTSFHFMRTAHLFYTYYFVIPIYFLFGAHLYFNKWGEFKVRTLISFAVILIIAASFGVYFALFGCLIILFSGICGYIRHKQLSLLVLMSGMILSISIGVAVNIFPNVVHQIKNGKNTEVAQRNAGEGEIYGFKLQQLVLPVTTHRWNTLAEGTRRYNSSTPLVNENVTASLGLVGAIGFLLAGFIFLKLVANGKVEPRMAWLAGLVLLLFLFGTVGGLGSTFSFIMSSSIRGWNRISIAISFAAILIFVLLLQAIGSKIRFQWLIIPALTLLTVFSILDSSPAICKACNQLTAQNFKSDREFFAKLELLYPGTAVYQLPYTSFPESVPINNHNTYNQLKGFLLTKTLLWNTGGMKGREGDLFYRSLALMPAKDQIDVIKKLGISGILIDRNFFSDNGEKIINDIFAVAKQGPLTSQNGQWVYFNLGDIKPLQHEKMKAEELMEISEFSPS